MVWMSAIQAQTSLLFALWQRSSRSSRIYFQRHWTIANELRNQTGDLSCWWKQNVGFGPRKASPAFFHTPFKQPIVVTNGLGNSFSKSTWVQIHSYHQIFDIITQTFMKLKYQGLFLVSIASLWCCGPPTTLLSGRPGSYVHDNF